MLIVALFRRVVRHPVVRTPFRLVAVVVEAAGSAMAGDPPKGGWR